MLISYFSDRLVGELSHYLMYFYFGSFASNISLVLPYRNNEYLTILVQYYGTFSQLDSNVRFSILILFQYFSDAFPL